MSPWFQTFSKISAYLLGVLWVLPLLYAFWAAFHPPEYATQFSLTNVLTLPAPLMHLSSVVHTSSLFHPPSVSQFYSHTCYLSSLLVLLSIHPPSPLPLLPVHDNTLS